MGVQGHFSCLFLCGPVQCVFCLLLGESWDRLQPLHDPEEDEVVGENEYYKEKKKITICRIPKFASISFMHVTIPLLVESIQNIVKFSYNSFGIFNYYKKNHLDFTQHQLYCSLLLTCFVDFTQSWNQKMQFEIYYND